MLTTYGRSSGFCVDPIEKKPLNHFLPGSSVLSFGTAGCNLACRFCQNWDISKSKEIDTLADAAVARGDRRGGRRLGCRSVAFTYNDPVIFMEYAIDVADACHDVGVDAVAVTAGYMCDEPRREFYAHMDAANVDLKAFTEDFYRHVAVGQLAAGARHPRVPPPRDRRLVRDHHAAHPGPERQRRRARRACADWVAERARPRRAAALHRVPSRLQDDRHPAHAAGDADAGAATSPSATACSYVYTGNVHDRDGGEHVLPGCGARVDRTRLVRARRVSPHRRRALPRLRGRRCPGRFDGPPGGVGRRRVPVRLGSSRPSVSGRRRR